MRLNGISIYARTKSPEKKVTCFLAGTMFLEPSNCSCKFVVKLTLNSCKDWNYQFPAQLSFYDL